MLAGHDTDYIRIVWIVSCAMGIAVVVALIVLYRRVAFRHELEVAERIIASHDTTDDAPDDRDAGLAPDASRQRQLTRSVNSGKK